jgi:hypothetical protein
LAFAGPRDNPKHDRKCKIRPSDAAEFETLHCADHHQTVIQCGLCSRPGADGNLPDDAAVLPPKIRG